MVPTAIRSIFLDIFGDEVFCKKPIFWSISTFSIRGYPMKVIDCDRFVTFSMRYPPKNHEFWTIFENCVRFFSSQIGYHLWNKNILFYQYLKRWRFCISQCFLFKMHQGIPYDDNDSLKNSIWWKNSRALISVALVKQKLAILRVISDLARKNNLHNYTT